MQSDKLPKMPDPKAYWVEDVLAVGGFAVTVSSPAFTAKQMQDYALTARKGALEEVCKELERRYAQYEQSLGGSYEDGQKTAVDVFQGWVERLMEQDA